MAERPGLSPPLSLDQAVMWVAEQLAVAQIDQPRRDARLLVAHAAGVSRQDLLIRGDGGVSAVQWQAIEDCCARRCQSEPVSRIVGSRGFWTLDLALNADTLDPRPDTETLVDAVLAAEPDRQRPVRILDLGTGTGCILLALLSEYPHARGVGVDVAAAAVDAARANAVHNGLAERAQFMVGNWADGLTGGFDVVVSNPPYIAAAEMAGLAPEVTRYDPYRALVSGNSGYEAYETLIPQMPLILADGGLLGFEVGAGQADRVGSLLRSEGFAPVWTRPDLAGVLRCVMGRCVGSGRN